MSAKVLLALAAHFELAAKNAPNDNQRIGHTLDAKLAKAFARSMSLVEDGEMEEDDLLATSDAVYKDVAQRTGH